MTRILEGRNDLQTTLKSRPRGELIDWKFYEKWRSLLSLLKSSDTSNFFQIPIQVLIT